jgi:hypothetical protein
VEDDFDRFTSEAWQKWIINLTQTT